MVVTYKMGWGYLFIAALVILFASCASPKPLVYKNVTNFGLKQAGFTNTVVSMDLCLYNPNNYKLKLKSTGVDVFVNNHLLGNVQLQQEYIMPRKDTFLLPVILKIDVASGLTNAYQLMTAKEVDLKLTGTVKAGRHGVYINIPVSYEGKQLIR